MNLRLAQNDDGEFFTLHTIYTGTFTVDIDIYNIKGKIVEGTYWISGNIAFQQMMEKYHYIPKELMDNLFIDIYINPNVTDSKVWSGL
jgi:hypothetical protein